MGEVVSLSTIIKALASLGMYPVRKSAHPGYKAGNWYFAALGSVAAGSVIAASSIRLQPFFIAEPVTISDLGARVTTLIAAGNFQLAIYAMDPVTKDPTGLALASTGSISTAAAAAVSGDITGPNVSLAPGWYWMAVNVDATAGGTVVFQNLPAAGNNTGFYVGSATQANMTGAAAIGALIKTIAQTYGTWPDLTGATFAENAAQSAALLMFKAA